ncbi:flagellar hook-associated protein FlgK [Mesorhizobium microcysteis]|uniref:Flagellar hook-associated protein 1 n=1 Tax=Neoaquamicrobium microcysteis TaxID=2682781 RepID=A0A5D4GP72_9HYPH|nr:flagellar hook-associated protein FlgK [Mesorhizobium microcysteis]TYR30137.1 flagellar hook-associated protein FlgK [Mesorhizobium microcysteis]
MSLSTALNIAQNSLLNTQRQTSVVSRNIANVYNNDYARRTAVLSSLAPGAKLIEIRRATDAALFQQNLSALSGWTAQSSVMSGLERLSISVNGVENATSPAKMISQLQEALQLYSSTPSNRTLGENAVEMARQVLGTLNQGTNAVQAFRTDMDGQIGTAVGELNQLLSDFKTVNDAVIKGTNSGRDILDDLDRRDALLKKISEYVPISTIGRANNDLMIVTADGTTLFETIPRHVGFEPTAAYGAATVGNRITVDGVPIFKATGANTSASGSLAAMLQMRDSYATGMQAQLDEVARGLIKAFSETDPNPPNDTLPGLFTWPGAPAMPADGTLINGLAGLITLNALVDPQQGGNPELLRDGINFDVNPNNHGSFNGLLLGFVNALDAPVDFVTVDGTTVSSGLLNYATASISWLEDARKTANGAAETKGALMIRTAEALSNLTSVNEDEEIALMLELERSYAASAKMMQIIDEMLKTLLNVVR